MGEVYRADDLVLGQPVALKFLPPSLERDPQRLPQFLGEIRNARQVAHPNVCRVYDVGSVGDRHFYSMEYVDGEDLSSLLRRIGRLPADKGLEIARQLCAALGAVHDRGLLHRDLKPSNVMLDGRGKVRLTDFGLAAAGEVSAPGVSGTPAYMAPEQFGGAPGSVQSDLYALGLVLYEVFTGQRLFDSPTLAGLRAQQDRFRPTDLSSTPVDLDQNPGVADVATDSTITFVFNDLMNVGTLVQPSTGQSPFINVKIDPDGNLSTPGDQVAVTIFPWPAGPARKRLTL